MSRVERALGFLLLIAVAMGVTLFLAAKIPAGMREPWKPVASPSSSPKQT